MGADEFALCLTKQQLEEEIQFIQSFIYRIKNRNEISLDGDANIQ